MGRTRTRSPERRLSQQQPKTEKPVCRFCGSRHWRYQVCNELRDAKAQANVDRLAEERKRAPVMVHRPDVKLWGDDVGQYRTSGNMLWLKDAPSPRRVNSLPDSDGPAAA